MPLNITCDWPPTMSVSACEPPLFSTTTACPNVSCSLGASERARMSEVPPGGYGTMIRMGFAGQGCAQAAPARASAARPRTMGRNMRSMIPPRGMLTHALPAAAPEPAEHRHGEQHHDHVAHDVRGGDERHAAQQHLRGDRHPRDAAGGGSEERAAEIGAAAERDAP